MPDPRAVLRQAALSLLLFGLFSLFSLFSAGSARAAGPVRFVEPLDGSMIVGPATMRFAVDSDEGAIDRIDVYIETRLIGVALPPEWTLDWQEDLTLRGETLTAVSYAGDAIVDRVSIRAKNFGGMQHVKVQLVQLYPVVRDGMDRYIRGLNLEDFIVLENGREVPLKHCANEVNSLNIVLFLDVSNSMETKLGRVQDASIKFADQLGPNDALALYAFNHRLHRIAALTVDHSAVREKIWYLRASGGTALYDGLMDVVEDLRDVPGRKAVIVFSDGQDKLSLASLSRVAREATGSEVIIYTVGAGQAGTAREDLSLLATQSGGTAYFIDRARDLASVYRQIELHLKAQYLLSYEPPPGPEELRQIEVKVRGHGYDVKCRTSYHYVPAE